MPALTSLDIMGESAVEGKTSVTRMTHAAHLMRREATAREPQDLDSSSTARRQSRMSVRYLFLLCSLTLQDDYDDHKS